MVNLMCLEHLLERLSIALESMMSGSSAAMRTCNDASFDMFGSERRVWGENIEWRLLSHES